jgi:hypothetical protein
MYYLDTTSVTTDKNGKAKGCVIDGVVYLFTPRSKTEDTPSNNEPPLRKSEEGKAKEAEGKAKAKAKAKAKEDATSA